MLNSMLKFKSNKESKIAFLAGLVAIALSLLLKNGFINKQPFLFIIIRDWLMIFILGICFVINRISNNNTFAEFGISSKHLFKNITINIVLAILLFFVMYIKLDSPIINISIESISTIVYIMLAGVFEALFYYSYQRVVFAKCFGKIPAIIMVSLFYSLHHVGFQPEFIKLFFVGLLYAIVVSLTNNIFSIYPFYWGVGATFDVLLQSKVVTTVQYPFLRSIILLLLIFVYSIYKYKEKQKTIKHCL
ncbi:hypothetical protein IMX26_03300 [Clostridium sp. 'deep sea']|uniref:CPBP family glutamic-type intramembrane protease n=1 Tax=Clostridium sp. 'deep sea' TaxID=2779445 RepID=UPI001896938C|nr:CPBP family glutamic-type intramembrane protease [Clostridium sp. 'deep sea']QOR35860.1 hypothetical protein IMX26_03300 [Clostridium sp. 'deep sea']